MIFPGDLILTAVSSPSVHEMLQGSEFKPWESYTLSHDEVIVLGKDSALIYYRVEATRAGETFRAICSSAWVLEGPSDTFKELKKESGILELEISSAITYVPMRIAGIRQSGRSYFREVRNMSGSVTYAAVVGTPNSTLRQPQSQARANSSFDNPVSLKEGNAKPQGPGISNESKPNPRGSSSKRPEQNPHTYSGPANETRNTKQIPKPEHKPNTEKGEELVYVLTLKITNNVSQPMNALREKYFPKHLNRTPAHLTLFHALPHSQLSSLEASLLQLSNTAEPFPVSPGRPFRMRRGVGVNVELGRNRLVDLHGQLRSQWGRFLSEQDAEGGFRPHWTVMNKVNDEREVDEAFGAVERELAEGKRNGEAVGVELWRYKRGRWEWDREYAFGKS
ncbi:hypothetical protein N0V83_004390 [Neocucurbitaria cava]|uniref:RNA ligase/cyclic nucleotide phosphodiesterase n=1 Tax=Neocucurbitaria cava TaxID=798079 RepID=A0A9W9CM52_9PLEO|nr:hypothetical protein N0V83_004390 [Neocucurbitaria cava]